MDRKTVAYAMVVSHVMDEALPALTALLDKYGLPLEEFAPLQSEILAHLFSHAYDTGAGNDGGPSDAEIEAAAASVEEAFSQMRAQVAEPNPLEELLAKLTADGVDVQVLDLDDECKAAGLC